MSVRVYVPTTRTLLRDVLASGVAATEGASAYAVTDAVRSELPDVDEEDREYVASSAAAQASVRLLRPDEPPRRAVLAVDVASVREAQDPDDPARVVLGKVATRQVAALLLDSADAGPSVDAARRAVLDGSGDAALLLELCLDHELGWWAAQEMAALLDEDA